MFSGIVEATAEVLFVDQRENLVEVQLSRPAHFDDLQNGDSIACNGVCLTVENFNDRTIQFALANETLSLLKIEANRLKGQKWNLERSLRFGDRVHGHLVTGHIEALGEIVRSEALGESWLLDVKVPQNLSWAIWNKGSLAVHGVSLTVNQFENSTVGLCLIPETMKRTNLGDLKPGDLVNIETDYLAKAYFQRQSYEL